MNNAVKDFQFTRGNLMLFPYDPRVGSPELALIRLYNRLKEEQLWDVVFHENTKMTMLEFMNFLGGGQNLLAILMIVDGETVVDFAGMAWLTDLANCQGMLNRGVGSFVYFKDYQKPMYTDQLGTMILDYWFNYLGLDLLVGLTPESNRAALVYIKRLGLKEMARLPGYTTFQSKPVAGVVTLLSKEEFRARTEE